jgi:7-keto-8-aminopelargonate synthetase-like enzyme
MDGRLVQNSQMAIKKSTDIFEKCNKFRKAKELMSAGIYPFFRVIESAQDPEVWMNGRRMIMVGSNNYSGLRTIRVKEAALEAMKIWHGCAVALSERYRYPCQA